jgi:hypothetical protein
MEHSVFRPKRKGEKFSPHEYPYIKNLFLLSDFIKRSCDICKPAKEKYLK